MRDRVTEAVMRILVTFAVPEEAGQFRRLRLPGVKVLVTGMGADAARRSFEAELEKGERPDCVISCGFCGALDPVLKRAAVLVAEDAGEEILNTAKVLGIPSAKFHCAETVATTAVMKAELRQWTGADAVEMESGVIGGICREKGIIFATVRVVSDEAGEDLPLDFNKLMNKRGGVHFGRLAMELARRPRMIPQLMRLQKVTRRAANALAEELAKLIGELSRGDQSP